MKAINFIKTVQNLQKTLFTVEDVSRLIHKPVNYTRTYLHRLKSRGYITAIEKNKYTLSQDPLEVGSNLVFPAYISFISAYYFYGLTTQIPVIVQVVTLKSRKPLSFQDMKIKFIKFPPKKIFGYSKQKFREKCLFIATKEKAIVDSLYLPEQCPISETFEALHDQEIDILKLIEFALQMDSIVILKRLGYLLEKQDRDIYPKVKSKLNARYDLLNPLLKRSKDNSAKWKLNINEKLG
ncbi:hypothetical protein HYU22_01835 [Candidatus Woesearchaeota archaeon]|nr:hypothetical protein [Candidatus Woesearchaeota archaeon]